MSDPIEQLRNLTQQGVDVTPLPPSEVRRRGDRLRRRNHVLAAVGGVAAIALIATPIALLAGGGERVQPPVDTPSTVVTPTETSRPAVVHEIPADFPLAVGAEADGGDFDRTGPSRVAEGVVFPSLCSDFRFGVIPQDRLGLNVTGPEYADDRTLMTFDRADNAVAAMQYLRAVVSNCPTDRNVVYDILPEADYDTGYDSFTFGASYTDGLGNDAWQATRVGRGLLLLHTYGEGTRDSIPADAEELTVLTGRITPAMCAFTEAGCG